jgi:hypothetical protein
MGGANKKRAKVTPDLLMLRLNLLCKALRNVRKINALRVKKPTHNKILLT